MKVVPFADYAAVILRRYFPPMKSRRELLAFMGGNGEANILWTDYIHWHCALRPAHRRETFRAWLKELKRDDCGYDEWCLIADMQRDDDWPKRATLDRMTDYLNRIGAPESTLDSLEALWLRYNLAD